MRIFNYNRLVVGYSYLVGKPIEFFLIFIPYFATKGLYARQWHANSLLHCFILSLLLFVLLLRITITKTFSITFALFLGLLTAYVSYKCGVIQLKLRDYEFIEPIYNKLTEKRQFNTDNGYNNRKSSICSRKRCKYTFAGMFG